MAPIISGLLKIVLQITLDDKFPLYFFKNKKQGSFLEIFIADMNARIATPTTNTVEYNIVIAESISHNSVLVYKTLLMTLYPLLIK